MPRDRPFAVGDRVAVYHRCIRFTGVVDDILSCDRSNIKIDGGQKFDNIEAHPKQLRLLKKKERRRVWLRLNLDGSVYDSTIKEPLDRS